MADPGGSDGAWGEWRILEGVMEPGESGGGSRRE